MEPPPPVAGAIRHADVWIEYAVAYILHTQAYKEALKNWGSVHLPHRHGCHDDGQHDWKGQI